ncbi:polysaccharide deacetylase family protein [Micropruina glycogenica]|uniref:NodB homology domain-containing protein n=1 Tax=Micropruina glycogenica TaxID=75385 RepID=A0A2N9JDY6_9ACTN|nr:polysaccharide deacetylase family protein [Micropruina glycogenica]SPD86352.1 conserved exported protein of unknown function [Micropruina glycogenica]
MSGRRWVVKAAVPLLILGVAIGTLRAGAETSERTGPPSATAAKAKAQAGVSGKKKKDPTAEKPATDSGATTTKRRTSDRAETGKQPATVTKKKATQATTEPKKPTDKQASKPSRRGYWNSYGPNTTRRVVLSFDDCPASRAAFRTVIDGAQRLGIALMLFPTGVCVRAGLFSPAYARAHGHYVFNHSISHPDLARLSYQAVLAQLGAPGIQSSYGRPPFGSYNATVARAYAAKGMRIWTWSLDTNDWRGLSQQAVVSRVVRHATTGGTVLMHMQWHGFAVSALAQMKVGLAERGLGVCRNFSATTAERSRSVRC